MMHQKRQRITKNRGRQGRRLQRHSVVSTAGLFEPLYPHLLPEEHFLSQTKNHIKEPRLINKFNSFEILLVPEGSCVNNGDVDATGGCSFKYKATTSGGGETYYFPYIDDDSGHRLIGGTIGFPLERAGPDGVEHVATSNRAKMRAVIGALQFRPWWDEGFNSVVILTNLDYIIRGAICDMRRWVEKGWRNRRRKPVENRDLWEELHGAIEELGRRGVTVKFWRATRKSIAGASGMVTEARTAAQISARYEDDIAYEFVRLCGIEV